MNRENASFTFLHRVEEIELNIRDGRWQSALALALTIPDICGGIAFPELVKRYRDGRIMLDRQKNPTRDVGNQYIRWFDEFAAAFFKTSADSAKPYICGERCWQLRCEYLHQNKGFLNDEDSSSVRFHLGVNCGTSVCQFDPGKENDEKNFELYNTPVLDFIQFSKPLPADKLVCVICPDYAYSKGLTLILQKITKHLIFCQSVEEANEKLRKKKVALWLLAGFLSEIPDNLWQTVRKAPAVLISDSKTPAIPEASAPNVTVLLTPVYPEILRSTVRKFL
ncbi:MAG: hypothetical protein Q4B00_12915 [Eubacteriales bacterium]|nr:hypothetical protein [Eubacteriales bacterium]